MWDLWSLRYETKQPLDNRVAAAQINNTASNKLLHLTRRNQCVSYRILLHAGSYSNSSETGKHARMSALNLVLFFDFPRSFLQQNFECYITSFPAENVKMWHVLAINQTRPRLRVFLQVWSGGQNNAINFYISSKIPINSMFSTVGLGNDFRHFFENSNPLHVPHCTAWQFHDTKTVHKPHYHRH